MNNKHLLSQIKAANPNWFSKPNKRFFGDRQYFGEYGKATGKAYLLRSTNAWTGMFDQKPTLHYRINHLDQTTLKIGDLTDDIFPTITDARNWLKTN